MITIQADITYVMVMNIINVFCLQWLVIMIAFLVNDIYVVSMITLSKKESQLKVGAQSMYSHLTFPDFWLSFLTAEVRF